MASSQRFAKKLRESPPQILNMLEQTFKIPARTKPFSISHGPDQTIGGIYRLFRKWLGGAEAGGVSAGSKFPLGRQLSVNYLKALCASRQWLGVNQLWGGGRGIHRVVPSYRKEGCRLGLSLPLETVHQQYSRRQRLERRCVGLVDQSPPKSASLAGSRPLSTVAVS
jgi:hypothetical protein